MIPFTKVEAIGNHFVLIDALDMPEQDWLSIAIEICSHHFGVGADGLLVILPSNTADFRLRMFNPDGTEDVCGNGLRCAALYVHDEGLSLKPNLFFEGMTSIHHAEVIRSADGIPGARVNMGRPSLHPSDIPAILDVFEVRDYPLDVGGDVYLTTAVAVGTPHAVICAPWESFQSEIPAVSRLIETHPVFPERVSVTWCSPESQDSIRVRTWERGVGPTLGCGTGACAAVVAANLRGLTGERALVTSPGGTLEIEWPNRGEIFLSGPANIVFRGEWHDTKKMR